MYCPQISHGTSRNQEEITTGTAARALRILRWGELSSSMSTIALRRGACWDRFTMRLVRVEPVSVEMAQGRRELRWRRACGTIWGTIIRELRLVSAAAMTAHSLKASWTRSSVTD